ncbi:hypothetical protein [Brenneria corticis]|uniref:Uncharacterized protein n=1 Tax=Brenneria corticis TaxID=2173106 RepID=A0A2U1TU85_9GAMM|nr:hypothetical protein [Brenneria sp. CFCC 11842]PWC12963.1 hypothetical protein DDT56_16150 [Brenneria sp. CFCC 11842]
MVLMSVSQYAKHAGMSRQALYSWEGKQGFPPRVNGKIDQALADAYLARFRDRNDLRTQNAARKTSISKQDASPSTLVEMSVAAIRQRLAECIGMASGMDPDERAGLAARAVGLYISTASYAPPITFGGYRLAESDPVTWPGEIVAGGAFDLAPEDVIRHCRETALFVLGDGSETEETACNMVMPGLLYVLSTDK